MKDPEDKEGRENPIYDLYIGVSTSKTSIFNLGYYLCNLNITAKTWANRQTQIGTYVQYQRLPS